MKLLEILHSISIEEKTKEYKFLGVLDISELLLYTTLLDKYDTILKSCIPDTVYETHVNILKDNLLEYLTRTTDFDVCDDTMHDIKDITIDKLLEGCITVNIKDNPFLDTDFILDLITFKKELNGVINKYFNFDELAIVSTNIDVSKKHITVILKGDNYD